MDSVTQAVLGAGIQGAMLGRFHGRKALAAGALLGTLPDLDVLIDYGNPVAGMINHRGFSHSLFVLTAVAMVLTAAWRWWRPKAPYGTGRLFLTLWLVLITHPLLDAFTSYGTQLWWPLTPTPTSGSSIFIIDPFFTVPLLCTVIAVAVVGIRPRAETALRWALGYCAVYLALSVAAKHLVEARVHQAITEDGTRIQAMFSTPQPFSILLWRVVARSDDDHYVEAISSLLDTRPPERIRQPLNSHLASALPHSELLAGLQWFTDNWLRYNEINGQLVVTDLRMGLGAGYYSFQFVMATRNRPGGAWNAVTPAYWPHERGTEHLPAVMRRIWQQQPPLPLADWVSHTTR